MTHRRSEQPGVGALRVRSGLPHRSRCRFLVPDRVLAPVDHEGRAVAVAAAVVELKGRGGRGVVELKRSSGTGPTRKPDVRRAAGELRPWRSLWWHAWRRPWVSHTGCHGRLGLHDGEDEGELSLKTCGRALQRRRPDDVRGPLRTCVSSLTAWPQATASCLHPSTTHGRWMMMMIALQPAPLTATPASCPHSPLPALPLPLPKCFVCSRAGAAGCVAAAA